LITALVFLGLAYVALYGLNVYFRFRAGDSTNEVMRTVGEDISGAMLRIWTFTRPILQLIIILFVIYWFSQIIEVTKDTFAFGALDIKANLAFFVIGAFCLASFLSDSPASWLKEIALVVIGFYFGTKAGG
jgi:hypothetical protein